MFIWPFASRKAHSEIRVLAKDLASKLARKERELDLVQRQLTAARSLIQQAHFHDPKTGRIGKKGVVPDHLRSK